MILLFLLLLSITSWMNITNCQTVTTEVETNQDSILLIPQSSFSSFPSPFQSLFFQSSQSLQTTPQLFALVSHSSFTIYNTTLGIISSVSTSSFFFENCTTGLYLQSVALILVSCPHEGTFIFDSEAGSQIWNNSNITGIRVAISSSDSNTLFLASSNTIYSLNITSYMESPGSATFESSVLWESQSDEIRGLVNDNGDLISGSHSSDLTSITIRLFYSAENAGGIVGGAFNIPMDSDMDTIEMLDIHTYDDMILSVSRECSTVVDTLQDSYGSSQTITTCYALFLALKFDGSWSQSARLEVSETEKFQGSFIIEHYLFYVSSSSSSNPTKDTSILVLDLPNLLFYDTQFQVLPSILLSSVADVPSNFTAISTLCIGYDMEILGTAGELLSLSMESYLLDNPNSNDYYTSSNGDLEFADCEVEAMFNVLDNLYFVYGTRYQYNFLYVIYNDGQSNPTTLSLVSYVPGNSSLFFVYNETLIRILSNANIHVLQYLTSMGRIQSEFTFNVECYEQFVLHVPYIDGYLLLATSSGSCSYVSAIYYFISNTEISNIFNFQYQITNINAYGSSSGYIYLTSSRIEQGWTVSYLTTYDITTGTTIEEVSIGGSENVYGISSVLLDTYTYLLSSVCSQSFDANILIGSCDAGITRYDASVTKIVSYLYGTTQDNQLTQLTSTSFYTYDGYVILVGTFGYTVSIYQIDSVGYVVSQYDFSTVSTDTLETSSLNGAKLVVVIKQTSGDGSHTWSISSVNMTSFMRPALGYEGSLLSPFTVTDPLKYLNPTITVTSMDIYDSSVVYIIGSTVNSQLLYGQDTFGGEDMLVASISINSSSFYDVNWVRIIGTINNDVANDLASTCDGVFVVGSTTGSFAPYEVNGTIDLIAFHINSKGDTVWLKQWGTDGSTDYEALCAISLTNNGFIIAGFVSGDINGDGVYYGGTDGYLAKLSFNGSIIWSLQHGTLSDDSYQEVLVANGGNIYVIGSTNAALFDGQSSQGETDVLVCKYASDGSRQWSSLIGSEGNDAPNQITFNDRYLYITLSVGGNVFYGYNTSRSNDNGLVVLGEIDGFHFNQALMGLVNLFQSMVYQAWTSYSPTRLYLGGTSQVDLFGTIGTVSSGFILTVDSELFGDKYQVLGNGVSSDVMIMFQYPTYVYCLISENNQFGFWNLSSSDLVSLSSPVNINATRSTILKYHTSTATNTGASNLLSTNSIVVLSISFPAAALVVFIASYFLLKGKRNRSDRAATRSTENLFSASVSQSDLLRLQELGTNQDSDMKLRRKSSKELNPVRIR